MATFAATSRTIFFKEHPMMTVEYRCQDCSKVSTLRNPILMSLGLPLASAGCAFLVVYNLIESHPGNSSLAVAMIAAAVSIQLLIVVGITRLVGRFEKTERGS
jgi:hypothetical protein